MSSMGEQGEEKKEPWTNETHLEIFSQLGFGQIWTWKS